MYINQDDSLTLHRQLTNTIKNTTSLAWGDIDGDSDLDLAFGNDGLNRVYRNNGSGDFSLFWEATISDTTTAIIWGDVNLDYQPDLIVGNDNEPNYLYLNDGGRLPITPTWQTDESDPTSILALANVDGDDKGLVDLVVGNYGEKNWIYHNVSITKILSHSATWSSITPAQTVDLSVSDYDNDGDMDFAVANVGAHIQLYRNDEGSYTELFLPSREETLNTMAVAWQDVDSDGDWDLTILDWDIYDSQGNEVTNEWQGQRVGVGWTQPNSTAQVLLRQGEQYTVVVRVEGEECPARGIATATRQINGSAPTYYLPFVSR